MATKELWINHKLQFSFPSSRGDDGDALWLTAAEVTCEVAAIFHRHGSISHFNHPFSQWRRGGGRALGCVLTIFCSYLPMYLHRHSYCKDLLHRCNFQCKIYFKVSRSLHSHANSKRAVSCSRGTRRRNACTCTGTPPHTSTWEGQGWVCTL